MKLRTAGPGYNKATLLRSKMVVEKIVGMGETAAPARHVAKNRSAWLADAYG